MPIGRPYDLQPNVTAKSFTEIATADQTAFTVTDGYTINNLDVYRNGSRLAQGRDFLANDGSTVTLLSGATVGDVIEFKVYNEFAISDAIVVSASDQTIDGDLTVTGTITGMTSVTGASIGIQSAGTLIGIAQTINFIGSGNTVVESSTGVLDVSIEGGGGGVGTAINYSDESSSPFSYIDAEVVVGEDMLFDTSNAGVSTTYVVSLIPKVIVASGIAVTVGAGKTLVIDALQIGGV